MVVLILIEAFTLNLATVWFAFGAIGAITTSVFAPENIILQTVIFTVIAAILLPLTRPFVKKFARKKPEPTNCDRMIGEKAVVIEKIDNIQAKGQVKVLGQIWTARAENTETTYEIDDCVTVDKIEGVKLIVK